jgi:hypothetical protein
VKELRTRFNDADGRRETLERIVTRLTRDDAERRYREIGAEIDRLIEADQSVPSELRADHEALGLKLKG